MSIIELKLEVDCPFCLESVYTCAEFDTEEGDDMGINSYPTQATCYDCDKDFYFKAFCGFEVEATKVSKRKIK